MYNLIGQLNWAVQGSRPEMSFDMIQMSTKLKQGRVEDLVRAIQKINRMNPDISKTEQIFRNKDRSFH